MSSYLQSEFQRPEWEHKTGKEGLEAALSMLRAQLGPLVTGAEGTRYAECSGGALNDLINRRLAEVMENAHRPRQSWPTRCTLLGLLVAERLPTRQ